MSELDLGQTSPQPMLVAAVLSALENGPQNERCMALEFLAYQTTLQEAEAKTAFPYIRTFVLGSDPQLRYFARKARSQLEALFPTLREGPAAASGETGEALPAISKDLGPSDILLHKIRLGSRYMAFEALDRLTESGDNGLAQPLLHFLEHETDPFKISFLVKRLGRLDHHAIPTAIASFLNHEDPRVVANAIEGLELLDVPEFRDDLARLASNPDNRIRGNAVRALHKYDPETAYQHLRTMLNSPDIALQDTGVFLLRILNPPDKAELTKLAFTSKFATIRLRALDIPLPTDSSQTAASGEASPFAQPTSGYQRMDLWGLAFSSAGAVALSFLAVQTSRPVATLVFLLLAGLISVFFRATTLSLPRIVVSLGLISCMLWGDSRLLVQLGILAVWLPWPRERDDHTDHLPLLSAWIFAVLAVILSQALQGNLGRILSLPAWTDLPSTETVSLIPRLATRHQGFQGVILAIIAANILIILHLPRFIIRIKKQEKPHRPFVIAILAGLLLIGALNLAYLFDTRLKLAIGGITAPEMILQPKK